MSLLKRLYRIARSHGPDTARLKTGILGRLNEPFGPSTGSDGYEGKENRGRTGGGDYRRRTYNGPVRHAFPPQVVDDLAVFGLTPPSSMEAVKRARNREIKKYHSDKFMQDQVKLETSKQIMQILNNAYDRLKKYYETHPG